MGLRTARWLAATLMPAMLLTGCVSSAYRDSVTQFGQLTRGAVAEQDKRLVAVTDAESERVRSDLAASHAALVLSPECAALMAGLPRTDGGPQCRITKRGNVPIEAVSAFANIRALGAALGDYSDALIAVAADAGTDRETFATSVAGLGTALGALDGAVRDAQGKPPATSTGRLDGIAAVIGKAGGLLLAAQRAHALKSIVRKADPVVQAAVALLTAADDRLGTYEMAARGKALALLQADIARLAATNAPVETMRAAQDAMFTQFDAFTAAAGERARYAAIGVAHAKLAAAAREGATARELADAIAAVLDLAATAKPLLTPSDTPAEKR